MNLARSRAPAGPRLLPPLGPVTAATLFHGLPGAPLAPSDPAAWRRELPVLIEEGLSGLALGALDRSQATIEPALREQLTAVHRAEIAMSRVAQAWAPAAVFSLQTAGVEAVVVKGPAVAMFYPRPGLRPRRSVWHVLSCPPAKGGHLHLVAMRCPSGYPDALRIRRFGRATPSRSGGASPRERSNLNFAW